MYRTVKTLAVKTLANIISIAKVFLPIFSIEGFRHTFYRQSFLLYGMLSNSVMNHHMLAMGHYVDRTLMVMGLLMLN